MLQDKTIKDLTKEQKQKLYLYLHTKIFNKDSQLITSQRQENVSDMVFHDVIMELLLNLLDDDDTDSEIELESIKSDDEEIELEPQVIYDRNKNIKIDNDNDKYNIKKKMEMVDKIYQKKDKN